MEFEIENGVLRKCLDGSISEAVIPEGVIEIGDSAFVSCDKLCSVVFPESLKSSWSNVANRRTWASSP